MKILEKKSIHVQELKVDASGYEVRPLNSAQEKKSTHMVFPNIQA